MRRITKRQFTTWTKRLNEIYQQGVNRMLDKMDLDATEWLTDDEAREYKQLSIQTDGQCPFCGEENGECGCYSIK